MTDDLVCGYAAESVSALADRDIIPAEAAQHIGACPVCQARLHDYLAIGAELRRMASLATAEAVPPLRSQLMFRPKRSLWQKGWETMKIPKLAFAFLIIAVLALASSLAVVKVRANSSGSVLLIDVNPDSNRVYRCVVNTQKKPETCAIMFPFAGNMTGIQLEILARDGGRVQLGVRTRVSPLQRSSNGTFRGDMQVADLNAEPQTQHWFEPGQNLTIPIEGAQPLLLTGQWADHVPALMGESELDPGPDELRMVSPLIIRDKQTIADMEGGSVTARKLGQVVQIYTPGMGRLLLSLTPMKDGVQGTVHLNRIKFQLNGQHYLLLGGAPISRGEQLWVRYEPNFKPASDADHSMIGAAPMNEIAPEAVPQSVMDK